MKKTLVRDCGEIYLQMDRDETESEFTRKMLSFNSIKGFIKPGDININGENITSYEVSGKESLEERMQRISYGKEEIKALLYAVANAEEECRRYMLCTDGIVLDPKYIFYDYTAEEYRFIYREDIGKQKSFKEFSEALVKESGSFADSAKAMIFKMKKDEVSKATEARGVCETTENEEALEKAETVKSGEEVLKREPSGEQMFYEEEGTSFKEYLLEKLKDRKKKKRDKKNKEECFSANTPIEEVIFEPEAEETYETVFIKRTDTALGVLTEKESGINHSIEKEITTIGKSKDHCDIVIDDDAVSRLHAKIIKDKDEYYIEDVNSKNGVIINGEYLEAGKERKLEKGDKINLGNSILIFN